MIFKSFSEEAPKQNQEFIGMSNKGNKGLYKWEYGAPTKVISDKCVACNQELPVDEDEYLVKWL